MNWYKLAQIQDMFDTSTTGMPYYDNMLQNPEYFEENKHKQFKITYMSPEEYINTIGQGFWQSLSPQSKQDYKNYQDMIQQRPMTSLIEKYMKVKDRFPMPVIEYNSDGQMISQEGHHRAIVAQNRDIKSIPVMIVTAVKGLVPPYKE